MVPKISETYFQSLLEQADAFDAISTISGFWAHRADEAKAMFGLSLPEYHTQLVLIYTGEVGNGGHVQFFSHRGKKYMDDLLTALEATYLHDLARALGQAGDIQDDVERFHPLDQQVWEQSSAVDRALQVFLRNNTNNVLVQERS